MGLVQSKFQQWRESRRRPARRPERASELPLYNITRPFENLRSIIRPGSANQPIPTINVIGASPAPSDKSTITTSRSKSEIISEENSIADDRHTETSFDDTTLSTTWDIPGAWPPPIPTINVIGASPTASDKSITASRDSKSEVASEENSVADDRYTETSADDMTLSSSWEFQGAYPQQIPTINIISASPTTPEIPSRGWKSEVVSEENSESDDRHNDTSIDTTLSSSLDIPGACPHPIPTINVIGASPATSEKSTVTTSRGLKSEENSVIDDRHTEISIDDATISTTPGVWLPPIPIIKVIGASPALSRKSLSYDDITKYDSKSEVSTSKDDILPEASIIESTLSTFHGIPGISTDEEVTIEGNSKDGVPDSKPSQPIIPETTGDNVSAENADVPKIKIKHRTKKQSSITNKKRDNDTKRRNSSETFSDKISDLIDSCQIESEEVKDIQSIEEISGSGLSTLHGIQTISGTSSSVNQYTIDSVFLNTEEVEEIVELWMGGETTSKSDDKNAEMRKRDEVNEPVPGCSRSHPIDVEAIVIEYPANDNSERTPTRRSVRFEDFIENQKPFDDGAKSEPDFMKLIDPDLFVEIQNAHETYCNTVFAGRKIGRSAVHDHYLLGVIDDSNANYAINVTEERDCSVPADLRSDAGLEFGINSSASALRKFLSGDEEGAWQLNFPWKATSIYNNLSICAINFLKAAITGHRGYIQNAEQSLAEFERSFSTTFYQNFIRRTCWNSNVTAYYKIHLTICKAECKLYRGILGLLKPLTLWNKFRTVNYISQANILYLKSRELYVENIATMNNTGLTESFKHNTDYVNAILNVIMALVPKKYRPWFTLLNCIKTGNRAEGIKILKHCHKKTNNTCGIMSDMILLLYNCNRSQLNTVIDHKRVVKIFTRFDKEGLKSPWVKFLHAKYLTMAGSFSESYETYLSILKTKPVAVLKQLIHCQLGYLYSLHSEWDLASRMLTPIPNVDDNFELTAYSKVAFRLHLRKFVIATEKKNLCMMFDKILSDEVVPPKDMLLYRHVRNRCFSYFEQNNSLVLPGMELINVMGFFDALSNNREYAPLVLEDIEEASRFFDIPSVSENYYDNDNIALVRYLYGCALRINNNPTEAYTKLESVLQLRDLTASHIIPFTYYEMARCEIDRQHFELSLELLYRIRLKYKGYEEQIALEIKIQEMITLTREAMPLYVNAHPKRASHPLLQPPPYLQVSNTNENEQ